jgi:hypothetical protein
VAFKALNIFLYLLFLVCLYYLFADRLNPHEIPLLVAIFAFNPAILGFLDNILSDIAYLFFSSLAIYLIDRIFLSKRKIFSSLVDAILLGITIFYAFFIRSTGIMLLATLTICQIIQIFPLHASPKLRIDRSIWVELAPYLVFTCLLVGSSMIWEQDLTYYLIQLNRLNLLLILKHVVLYTLMPSLFWYPGRLLSNVNILVTVLLTPLLLLGVWSRKKTDYPFIVYAGLTTVFYIFWPPLQGLRFIFPVLPFYVYFIYLGSKWLVLKNFRSRHWSIVNIPSAILVVVILVFFSITLSSGIGNLKNHRQISGPFDSLSAQMFAFVSQYTREDDTFIFFKPRILRLITQRNAFYTESCAEFPQADYLILYKETDIPTLTREKIYECQNINLQNLIFSNQRFDIYRVGEN